jgi:hypothetical protein
MACAKVSPIVIHPVLEISMTNDRAIVFDAVNDVKRLCKSHACDQYG